MASDIVRGGRVGGEGCTTRQGGLPPHNPEPTTARGRRRQAGRNSQQQAIAAKAWATPRSNRPSRYEKILLK